MRPSPIRSFRRPSRSSGARSRKCGRAAPRWNRKARAGNDRRTRIGTRMSDKGMFGNLGNLMKQAQAMRSEEHTSELQSRLHLVCRLLLEKKKREYRLKQVQG